MIQSYIKQATYDISNRIKVMTLKTAFRAINFKLLNTLGVLNTLHRRDFTLDSMVIYRLNTAEPKSNSVTDKPFSTS
jgi:hypothetical protein